MISIKDFFIKNKRNMLILIALSGIAYFLIALIPINQKASDVMYFNRNWSLLFNKFSLFHVYDGYVNFTSTAEAWKNVNYPPIFIIFLWLVHPIVTFFNSCNCTIGLNITLKILPILFHIAICLFFYFKKEYKWCLLWCVNPLWILVTPLWGQLDEPFCFLIILSIQSLRKQNYTLAGIVTAVACLLKLQGGYFVIFYGIVMLLDGKRQWGRKIKSGLLALAIFFLGWLPWMISYHNALFGVTFYFNQLSILNCNGIFVSTATNFSALFTFITNTTLLNILSKAFTAAVLILTIWYMYKKKDVLTTSIIYWSLLFLFTFGQHERYILYPITCMILLYFNYKQPWIKNSITLWSCVAFIAIFACLIFRMDAFFEPYKNLIFGPYRFMILAILGLILTIRNFIYFPNFLHFKQTE